MRRRITFIIFLFLGIVLLFYTGYRAAHLSLVYDEAITYKDFIFKDVDVIFEYPYLTANNHVLNSLLIKWAMYLGPPNEFILRLPNLFAHLIFIICSWFLFSGFKSKWIQLFAFVIINFNPFLLDYFSMARGYGLSLGFLMAGLLMFRYFLVSNGRIWMLFLFLCLIFLNLAVLASFTLISLYAVLILLVAVYLIFRIKAKGLTLNSAIAGFLIIVVSTRPVIFYDIPKILELKAAGELYFGGSDSFWSDTVARFFNLIVYYKTHSYLIDLFFRDLVYVVPITTGLVFLWIFFTRNWKEFRSNYFFFSIFMILCLCSAGSIVQHYLFKVPFLTERTALYLMVIFGILAMFLVDFLYRDAKIWGGVVFIFAIASLYNTVSSINFSTFLLFQDHGKEAMAKVEKDFEMHHDSNSVAIASYWVYAPVLHYYKDRSKDNWLKIDDSGKDSIAEYFYTGIDDFKKFKPGSYKILEAYPEVGSVLLKRIDGPENPYFKAHFRP